MLTLPAVALTVAVLTGGLSAAALQSLGLMPLFGEPHFTVSSYTNSGADLLTSVRLSLLLAAASTALAGAVGLTTAVAIGAHRGAGRVLAAASSLAIPLPHLVGAAAIGLLLADSGLLARLLHVSPDVWPQLVGGRYWIAVVAEYAWKESAFVALVVAGSLATRISSYTETAAVLGAGPWARQRFVTVPLAMPALVASTGISFAYTVGSYEVAWLLGRAYPEPLPVMSYRLFTSIDLSARPQALAVALCTTALALGSACVALILLRRTAAWR